MKLNLTRWFVFALIVAGIVLAVIYRDQLDATAIKQWVQSAGFAGPLVFMLVYIVGTLLFLPGSVLTLAGGALFGPVLGTLYNLTAATIGAALAFVLARYLAADWVKRKTGGSLKQLADGVENEGWRFVAFVRLVPLFPFNLLNYALGVTRIKLSHYIVATYIFMLPGAFAYTYLGYAGSEAIAGNASLTKMIQIGSIALALLAIVAFLPRLIMRLRQGSMLSAEALKQKLDQAQDLLVIDVRSVHDFDNEQGHIVQAMNIPLEELDGRLHEVSDYLEKPIALVCRTEKRSLKAAQLLTRHGYAEVHVIKGGMTAWNNLGYAVK